MALIGNTVRLEAEFEDFDGELVSPDDVKVIIYDGRREIIHKADVTPYETGKYHYDYTIPAEPLGQLYVEFSGMLAGKPKAGRTTLERRWV